MQKYALNTFDMYFVVSSDEFLTRLAINGAKKHANATTSDPYS
jgi:hypothetical protein